MRGGILSCGKTRNMLARQLMQLDTYLARGRAHAEDLGIAVVIAIVDARGTLSAYLRMEGSFLLSEELAIDKAWSAASFRMATAEIGAMLDTLDGNVRDGLLRRPRLTTVPGGIPLSLGGSCIGAVGISGGTAEQDAAIANAILQLHEEGIAGAPH